MKRAIFAGYLVVEIAAFWAMVHFLGWGWALVITVAAAGVGFAVLGRRARELFGALRTPESVAASPGRTFSDSTLFAGAALLTVLPGVVSTLGGLILLSPPVRNRLAPVVTGAATKRAGLFAERVRIVAMTPNGYVDGSVVGEGRVEESVIVETTIRNPDGTIAHDLPALPPVIEGEVIGDDGIGADGIGDDVIGGSARGPRTDGRR